MLSCQTMHLLATALVVYILVFSYAVSAQNEGSVVPLHFECPEASPFFFRCPRKSSFWKKEWCYGMDIVTEEGVAFNAEIGFSPCDVSSCVNKHCNTKNWSNPQQLFTQNVRLSGCACSNEDLSQSMVIGVRYTEKHPNYRHNDTVRCAWYKPCSRFPEEGFLRYKEEDGTCECCQPAGALNEDSITCSAAEVDPNPPPSSTAPTPPKPFDVIQNIREVCLNMPANITPALLFSNLPKMCCTVFVGVNSTVSNCGTDMFNLPEGIAYCDMQIPDNDFCCQVRIWDTERYTYYGDECKVPGWR